MAKLAAGGVDIVAARDAEVSDDVGGAEDFGEAVDARLRRFAVFVAGEAGANEIVGDEIHMRIESLT